MKLTYSLESVLQNDFGEMTVCFGLEFQKFLSDLEFTADTDYRGYEEYPEEAFHDTLANLMEQFAEDKLELPLLFSVELDEQKRGGAFLINIICVCLKKGLQQSIRDGFIW